MSKTYKSLVRIFLTAAVCAASSGCKQRLSDTLASAPGPNTGQIGKPLRSDFTTPKVGFLLTSPSDGLVRLFFSYYAGSSVRAPNAPNVTVTDAGNGAPLVTGDLFIFLNPFTKAPGFYVASALVAVKAGQTLAVNATDGGVGSAAGFELGSEYVELKASTMPADKRLTLEAGSATASFRATSTEYAMELDLSHDVLARVEVSATIANASTTLFNPYEPKADPSAPETKLELDDGGKTWVWTDPGVAPNQLDATAHYLLKAGRYPLRISSKAIVAGSVVDLSVRLLEFQAASVPIPKLPPLSGRSVKFGEHVTVEGIFDPATPLVFEIPSDKEVEAKLGVGLSVTRIANLARRDQPMQIGVGLMAPADPTKPSAPPEFLMKTALLPPGSVPAPSDSFGGTLVANLHKGLHRLALDTSKLTPGDLLNISLGVGPNDLILPEGGRALGTFDDKVKPTLPPPSDYAKDNNVKTQPHSPDAPPQPLAQRAVLAAMEATRAARHLRLPRGSARGPTNVIDPPTIAACAANLVPHWSDLQVHFYCQFGQARACYTGAVRAGKRRKDAYDLCTKDPAFKAEVVDSGLGDIFQYVMFAQTYAFDDQQQQDVINAFYRIDDPTKTAECKEKRPLSGLDPKDGTHCLPSYGASSTKKTMQVPLSADGT